MRSVILCALAIAISPFAFAQLESNSLTVNASRSSLVAPDQALFSIRVSAEPAVSLTQVLNGVQKAGVTGEHLTDVETDMQESGFRWVWLFLLPVPLNNITDLQRTLTELQQSPDTATRGLSLSFSLVGARSSPTLITAQRCPVSELLAEARAEAQKMANAASLTLGPVLAIGDADVSRPTAVLAARIGTIGFFSFDPLPQVTFCSISVKFRLGG